MDVPGFRHILDWSKDRPCEIREFRISGNKIAVSRRRYPIHDLDITACSLSSRNIKTERGVRTPYRRDSWMASIPGVVNASECSCLCSAFPSLAFVA